VHFLGFFFWFGLVAEKLKEVEYMNCLGPLGLKARLLFLSHSMDSTTDRDD
jgi:hypothetical protein